MEFLPEHIAFAQRIISDESDAMENEDMACGDDVTIYLVKKPVTDEANRERKRRKLEGGVNSGTSSGEILGEIRANSQKLRQRSKHFEACMSERWTSDAAMELSPPFEFHLEVQTEVSYYKDCFSRMRFAFPKPIPSIKHCIELLKVATQIQCQNVMDVGMKFLAGVSWGDDDRKLIRDFCDSGHFAADSVGDLKERLDFTLTKEERVKKWSAVTKRSLSHSLQLALSRDQSSDIFDWQKMFADALEVIVSDLESDISQNLVEHVVTLLRIEGEKILKSFNNIEFWRVTVEERVVNFCWLYHMSRIGNASQAMVELIFRNDKMLDEEIEKAEEKVQFLWAGMIYKIFEDVLNGQLLLKTRERFSLFSNWNWILRDEYMKDVNVEDLVEFITNVVQTFPLLDQEYIYGMWGTEFDGAISQSRTAWLMFTVKQVVEGGSRSEL